MNAQDERFDPRAILAQMVQDHEYEAAERSQRLSDMGASQEELAAANEVSNVVLNCIRNIFDELAFSSDAMFAIKLLEEKCKHFETAHVATREAAAMRYINDVRSLNKLL